METHVLAAVERVTQISSETVPDSKRRVAAVVGLALLEVIREQDLPSEVLDSEDPSITMPRRLGLSEVIERQIRRYRDEVKRGQRLADGEVVDLVRLVVRRPDSEEVFFYAGRILAGKQSSGRGLSRVLPRPLAFALARRKARQRLQRLFGRRVGGWAPGVFTMEGRALIFIQGDPGGDACLLVSGLCQGVLDRYLGGDVKVVHSLCESRKDALCRWTVFAERKAQASENAPEFLLKPEPEAG